MDAFANLALVFLAGFTNILVQEHLSENQTYYH